VNKKTNKQTATHVFSSWPPHNCYTMKKLNQAMSGDVIWCQKQNSCTTQVYWGILTLPLPTWEGIYTLSVPWNLKCNGTVYSTYSKSTTFVIEIENVCFPTLM